MAGWPVTSDDETGSVVTAEPPIAIEPSHAKVRNGPVTNGPVVGINGPSTITNGPILSTNEAAVKTVKPVTAKTKQTPKPEPKRSPRDRRSVRKRKE